MIQITKLPRQLSDGSVVHDVLVGEDGRQGDVVLHAIDEKSADRLVEIIRNAIAAYTVELVVSVELEIS